MKLYFPTARREEAVKEKVTQLNACLFYCATCQVSEADSEQRSQIILNPTKLHMMERCVRTSY